MPEAEADELYLEKIILGYMDQMKRVGRTRDDKGCMEAAHMEFSLYLMFDRLCG